MRKLQNIALLHLSIIYLSIIYFIWCTTRYKMRRTRVPCKMTRSTKLWGAQRSPELGLRNMDFRAPENLIFPALQSFYLQTFLFFNPLMSCPLQELVELLVLELFWYMVNTLWKKNDHWRNLVFAYRNG